MHDPTTDAGYTTAGASQTAKTIGQFLALEGESIYEGLGCSPNVWTAVDILVKCEGGRRSECCGDQIEDEEWRSSRKGDEQYSEYYEDNGERVDDEDGKPQPAWVDSHLPGVPIQRPQRSPLKSYTERTGCATTAECLTDGVYGTDQGERD